MLPPSPEAHVPARLKDYWRRRSPWQRRLWNPGALALLAELIDIGGLAEQGVIKPGALKSLAETVRRRLQDDQGLGPDAVRGELLAALARLIRDEDRTRTLSAIRYLADRVRRDGYLTQWRTSIADPEPAGLERLSRVLGAHLLDQEFSGDQLYRWLEAIEGGGGAVPLDELFEAAIELEHRPTREFQIAVPLIGSLPQRVKYPATFLGTKDLAGWIKGNIGPDIRFRHSGGFIFTIEAKDPWAGVERAADRLDQLRARVAVALPTQAELLVEGHAYVAGHSEAFVLARPQRQVDVQALVKHRAVLDPEAAALNGPIGAALELLAPLEHAAPGAAVAGGWAAIETVLASDQTNTVKAADQLAVLIACSLPRAELTTLAYVYRDGHSDDIADDLASAKTNRQLARRMADALTSGAASDFVDPSHAAAAQRMVALLAEPRVTLYRIVGYVTEALHRLYRARNALLHGALEPPALQSTLHAVPPLVGAGFDRIVHAVLTDATDVPEHLVSRAGIELQLVGSPSGRHVIDLLELTR